MIHSGPDKLVRAIGLRAPDISIYAGDLVKCSTLYNCFSSAGEVLNIRSLSFCFFRLVQARKCLKKPESDKQEKLSVYFEKASHHGLQKKQEKQEKQEKAKKA